MKIGTDAYALNENLYDFLENAHRHDWQIYDIQAADQLYFHASITSRHDILRTYPQALILYTGGVIGMGLRSLMRIERVTALICCCICWMFVSHIIFETDIRGDSAFHELLLLETLEELQMESPFFLQNSEQLKDELWMKLQKELNWLEVSKNGSKLDIRYLGKKHAEPWIIGTQGLVAQKDGVIASFDVTHGNKVAALNQHVSQGDLLVSPILVDSMNQEKETYVHGKVYAYTFVNMEIEIEPFSDLAPLQYYECLFAIRMQVSEMLEKDEYIVKEIPLQFMEKEDKIMMKNYYVLYEQIAVTGELNETE